MPARGQHYLAGAATTGPPRDRPVSGWGKAAYTWIWDHLYFLPFLSPSLLSSLSQLQLVVLQVFIAVWGQQFICSNIKP